MKEQVIPYSKISSFRLAAKSVISDTLVYKLYEDVLRVVFNDNKQICLRDFVMENNCFKGINLINDTLVIIPFSSVKFSEIINVTKISYDVECGDTHIIFYAHCNDSIIIPTTSTLFDFLEKDLYKKPFFVSTIIKYVMSPNFDIIIL